MSARLPGYCPRDYNAALDEISEEFHEVLARKLTFEPLQEVRGSRQVVVSQVIKQDGRAVLEGVKRILKRSRAR